MRLSYPTNVKIVKVPCTGRVDTIMVLKAFETGVDGVYLAGCELGDCHFIKGNIRAKKRVAYLKEILKEVGIEPDRIEMYHISTSDGPRFAQVAKEMTEKIRALGPSPIRDGKKVFKA
jgi:F420-non-reducing hydrogenase iron-sulfur subunit